MSELEKVTAVDTTYDASEIQVLEGLEAVRKRPGMYIGSTSASGLHHLVYEIVDNAIDEALAGYCTEITVTINPGNTITVTDNGRGIPVDIQKQTGRPALEVVYTVLHAGGKFGGGGYKVSGGLHGVGASVVNALSQWLEVQVQKDGRIYEMKFSRGGITQEMKILGDTNQTGTAVTFKPDPEMFDTLVYDYETLHTRMREQAFLNAGLRITITDARPGQEQSDSMCYEGGIREFVTWLNRNKTALHEEVVYLAGAKGDSTAEVALQYNDSYNETLVSFANDIHTPEGGMHETGFKAALTRALNAYGKKSGILKEGDSIVMDIGAPFNHYWCDMTRTVFYKSASEEQRTVYETVRRANEAAIAVVKPGVAFKEIDLAARKVIEDAGYGEYFTHRTGHSIGMKEHEQPPVSSECEVIAKPGMIFSIEPGIYLPGKFGVRVEDLVLVTEDGCEVLNKYPKDLIVVE